MRVSSTYAGKGFTLIEALMAAVVLAITMSATFQVFFSTARANARANDQVIAHDAIETQLENVREIAIKNLTMAYRVFDGVDADDLRSESPYYESNILDGNTGSEGFDFRLRDGVAFSNVTYKRTVENRLTKGIKENGVLINQFPMLPPNYFYVSRLSPLKNTATNKASAYNANLYLPNLPQGEIILGARVPFDNSISGKTRCVLSEQPTPVSYGGDTIYPFMDINMDGRPEDLFWSYKTSLNNDDGPDKTNPYTDRMYWDTTQGTMALIENAAYETGGSVHPDFPDLEYHLRSLPVMIRVFWTPYGGTLDDQTWIRVSTIISERSTEYGFTVQE